jgi:hypothetical protein
LSPKVLLSSIELIESTILTHAIRKINDINILIKDEIEKIQSSTSDSTILSLTSYIQHNWLIFSGEKYCEGAGIFNHRQIDLIIEDCRKLKEYLSITISE